VVFRFALVLCFLFQKVSIGWSTFVLGLDILSLGVNVNDIVVVLAGNRSHSKRSTCCTKTQYCIAGIDIFIQVIVTGFVLTFLVVPLPVPASMGGSGCGRGIVNDGISIPVNHDIVS
jgi:hypothetical protein